jgi:TolB-like protein
VAHVFLSYKAEDRPRVAPLVQALEADGLSVWWDAHIGGGDDWRDTILRNLEAAGVVIVVWSKRSLGPKGRFVRDEASRALKRGTYFPIHIDDVDPPLGFGEMQALNLTGWAGDRSDPRYEAVRSALHRRLGLNAATAPPLTSRWVFSRRSAMAGGAAATVATAGAGGWFLLRPRAAHARSIAVLPFANLSGDRGQDYFSDGIAEELRSALSRIAGLNVVARSSSEVVRNLDAKIAAQKLGVTDILTGSVRRSASVMRISAQLVDGSSGTERWSDSYDRASGDALIIQTDIAQKVAEALQVRLIGSGPERVAFGETNNPAAQDLLLKVQLMAQHSETENDLQQALGMVNAALALDPNYGNAIGVKARILTTKAGGFIRSAAESHQVYQQAELTARQAIRTSPKARIGYLALAEIYDQQLRRRAAFDQFHRMLSVPGSDAKSLPPLAIFLSEIGRSAEALKVAEQVVKLDPLNPQAYAWQAKVLGNGRRFADALKVVEQQLKMTPEALWPRGYHAFCQMMLGDNAQARKEFEALPINAAPEYFGALAARQGDTALAQKMIDWLWARAGDAANFQYAEIYAQLGRKDDALEALDKAWIARDPGLTFTLVDPLLDPLRKEPRFIALFEKLDFPT